MEFLGIGPLEIFFILLITLIVIGPKDMVKSGRTIGRTLRKIVTSQQWQMVTRTSREIRNIPNRLIREAGLEDVQQDVNALKQTTADIQKTIRESTILPPGWKGQVASNQAQPTAGDTKPQPTPTIETAAKPAEKSDPEFLTIPGPAMPAPADLSAWTGLTNDLGSSTSAQEQAVFVDDLSAWISPPAASRVQPSKRKSP